jgi:hypothetical protein
MKHRIRTLLLAGSLAVILPAQAQEQKPAAEAPKPAAGKPEPAPGQEPDPEILLGIMNCLADGLPPDWRKAWFVIKQTDRNAAGNAREFEATFFYATSENDTKGERLKPCGDGADVLDGVGRLNAYLPENQRRWSGATFTFFRDGRYGAVYDQTPFQMKPAATSPAAKPAAKSGAKPAAKKKQDAK